MHGEPCLVSRSADLRSTDPRHADRRRTDLRSADACRRRARGHDRVHRGALALVLAGLLLVYGAPPAGAVIPVTDYAHIAVNQYWHYVHYVQFAFQIYQHVTQIANQARQIDNQLRALSKLRNPNWREIQSLLTDLDFLVRSGRAIGYSFPDPGGQLRQVYPGWTP
ncbi:MAG TPA: hypothetical protein VHB47_07130, partial [Thermoanaerobaculia bacterium]|nr:hypothetical protein [Thermoanaerobaculia bacterium]